EVFEGKAAGVRSDIYSLGILAYEVVAGERPFVADSYEALMIAHHTGVPRDLLAHRPDLDPRVKRVVSKAMARDPEKRYASAREGRRRRPATPRRPRATGAPPARSGASPGAAVSSAGCGATATSASPR